MKYKSFVPYIGFTAWIILLWGGLYFSLVHDVSLESSIFWFKKFILEHTFVGILIFIVLYCLRPLFFVIALPFDIFSWMVFGPVLWFFVSGTATFFSTMFTYLVWRGTSWNLIEKIGSKKIHKFQKRFQRDIFFNALVLRFILFPFDLWNYISGALKVHFWKYVTGTSLGVLPANFVFVSTGSAFYGQNVQDIQTLIQNINYERLWISSIFLLTILVVSKILKKRFKYINL